MRIRVMRLLVPGVVAVLLITGMIHGQSAAAPAGHILRANGDHY